MTITIGDNDHVPVMLGWEQDEVTIGEPLNSGGTTEGTLTVFATTTKDKMPESGFTFDITVNTANVSARQPGDYEQLSETLTFERTDFFSSTVNGQGRYRAEKTVTLVVAYDGTVESNETFTVTAAYSDPSQPHLQGGQVTATATITDDLSSTVDLEASASTLNPRVLRGVNIAYSYAVRNDGPASSTNTVLTATLDPGVSFLEVNPPDQCTHSGRSQGGVVTCPLGTLDANSAETGQLLVQGALTASMDFTITFSVDQQPVGPKPRQQ